jgi:1,5-anhydro-D-fructose reductase (1,5-anhydro-D-mannitol-forming)
MGDKLVRWGMIGTGDVTERKSAPSFNRIDGSVLMAVGSRTYEKAEDYARRHGIPKLHRDPFDVIRDEEVDAVYIATPPGAHREYALESIRAGKPVYIEKPMARTFEECREINEAAGKKGVPVWVAYYRRSLPYFLKVKEIVDSGRLGKILQVRMIQHFAAREEDYDPEHLPWRLIPSISGGGYFHDMGCHALDILFHIFGDPVRVEGLSVNRGGLYEADDTVSALLELPGGVPVTGSWSFVTLGPFQQDRIEVSGEKGLLSFSIFSFDPIRLNTGGRERKYSSARPEHIQMPLIRSIVDELGGRGTCPSTGLSAQVTSRVMDRICGNPA